jgi:hypothetical protein
LPIIALLIAAAALTSCKGTTKSGTAYTQLPNRELEVLLNEDLATVHKTAVDVLKDDFGYTIKKEAKDALEGVIEAATAQNDKVTVQTFKDGDNVTKVQVWVGPLGDRPKSELILSKLEEQLK